MIIVVIKSMPVLINFKICDNAKECNGAAVCPTGALSWDDKKKTIKIDNKKCTSCGKCESACMIGSIMVAKNEKEYKGFKKEIDNDLRKASDLFVDRYGASPIGPVFLIPKGKFDLEVLQSSKMVAVELYDNDSIKCLLVSIPVSELLKDLPVKYRKFEVKDKEILKKYKISQLPAMLFFQDGKLVGKIEGFYGKEQKKELEGKIGKIVNGKKK